MEKVRNIIKEFDDKDYNVKLYSDGTMSIGCITLKFYAWDRMIKHLVKKLNVEDDLPHYVELIENMKTIFNEYNDNTPLK